MAGGLTTSQYDNPVMHIELARFFAGAAQVLISCDTAFTAKNAEGNALLSVKPGSQITASVSEDGHLTLSQALTTGDFEASQAGADETPSTGITDATISSESGSGFFSIALPGNPIKWHRYRGAISLAVSAGHLRITNDIPLEEYLVGVLKPEIGASAPLEALKAQAIAARTYAVRNIGHLASESADLDDTTRTQSYLGVDGETSAIRAAVQATAGLVMTYQGQPIEALYSTDCGGMTAQGGPGEPYLQPVDDPDCAAKPAWTKTYSRAQLQATLQKSPQTAVDGLTSLSIESTDASGRAAKVLITGEDGQSKKVTGAQLRLLLGTEELRSTLFTVKQEEDGSFIFTGHGWGHGLGMCQQGAIALAEGSSPQPCDKILKHYYMGIEIVPLTPELVSAVTGGGKTPAHEISSSAVLSGGKS
jgi:stage II sporulation protein D